MCCLPQAQSHSNPHSKAKSECKNHQGWNCMESISLHESKRKRLNVWVLQPHHGQIFALSLFTLLRQSPSLASDWLPVQRSRSSLVESEYRCVLRMEQCVGGRHRNCARGERGREREGNALPRLLQTFLYQWILLCAVIAVFRFPAKLLAFGCPRNKTTRAGELFFLFKKTIQAVTIH